VGSKARGTVVALGLVTAAVFAGCGNGSATKAATSGTAARTVGVTMTENEFNPSGAAVKAGETVKFVFTNKGKVAHDAVIGDQATQDEHEKTMTSGMGMHHGSEGDAITVQPGGTGSITHTFRAADSGLFIGCHQPGHYKSGMRLTITL